MNGYSFILFEKEHKGKSFDNKSRALNLIVHQGYLNWTTKKCIWLFCWVAKRSKLWL